MKFTLNFSQSVYYNRALVRSSLIFGIVVCSLFVLTQAWNYKQLSKSTDQLTQEFLSLSNEREGINGHLREYSQAQKRELTQQVDEINQLIEDVTFQWSQFLTNLEEVVPRGVKVRSVAPKGRDGSTQVSAVARNLKSMRRFIDNLYASPLFSHVELSQHGSMNIKDRQGKEHNVISFSLAVVGKVESK